LQVGIEGEENAIFTEKGSKKVEWKEFKGSGQPISWYKVKVTGLKFCNFSLGDSIKSNKFELFFTDKFCNPRGKGSCCHKDEWYGKGNDLDQW